MAVGTLRRARLQVLLSFRKSTSEVNVSFIHKTFASDSNTYSMLDSFEILTTSGIVLWHKHYVPISPTPINNLINDVLIEERGSRGIKAESSKDAPYRTDKYTLRWARAKDVGVVFVVRPRLQI